MPVVMVVMVAMDLVTLLKVAETAETAETVDRAICPAVTVATGEAGLPLLALLSRAVLVATEDPVYSLVTVVTEVTAVLHCP